MGVAAERALDVRRGVEHRVAALDGCVARLVAKLSEAPPRDRASLEALMREIQRHSVDMQPDFHRIQHEISAATRSAAEKGERLAQPWYDLGTRVGALRSAMNQWPRFEALLRRQIAEPKAPLLPRSKPMQTAQDHICDAAIDRLHRVLNPLSQSSDAAEQGAYADIAMPQSQFSTLAHAAYRVGLAQGHTEMSFLDVGCGIGLKLVTAATMFDGVAGIELDQGYAERAQDLLRAVDLPKSKIETCDARDFGHYGSFHVVYLFRPMEDMGAMAALEEAIVSAAMQGMILIAPYKGMRVRHRDLGLWPLADGLYLSGETRRSAAALKRRAEYIGPAMRPPKDLLRTPWTPLLEVSHANGFDLEREATLAHV